MEIKSFDVILNEICDYFDSLISPRKIARANTNIIYLIFKAISKGWEVINNVCVTLNNKFNPALCTSEDLESTGKLVGTKKRSGSVSGLRISAYNSTELPVILPTGTYTYIFNNDVSFSFDVEADIRIEPEDSVYFTALSGTDGAYRVTQQTDIAIVGAGIPEGVIFSCSDNQNLLGHLPETDLEFRQRVNTDVERQDVINELKERILELPYVYDVSLVFNREESSISVGDFTVPPFYLLIIISTAKYTNEIADIVAQSAIYPTVGVENVSHEVRYVDSVFANGYYPVYLNDFVKKDFKVLLNLVVDYNYNTAVNVRTKIESALQNAFNTNIYRASITAEDVFNEINKIELSGVKVMGVTFEVDSEESNFVNFNRTELPNLTDIGGI